MRGHRAAALLAVTALAVAAAVGVSPQTASAAGGGDGVTAYGSARDAGPADLAPASPLVGIAATPSGDGYWLVARDGGVFSFGDASFHGSTGATALNEPVVGMAATPSGDGYWLVARDGGVFSFGDASFHGSTGALELPRAVVGISAAPDGEGYLLAAADGGVFAFGSAEFEGSTGGSDLTTAVGIAAARGGGYWVALESGHVIAFGTAHHGGAPGDAPTVGIAAHTGGGYWTVQAAAPPAPESSFAAAGAVDPNHPFLSCTRAHESDSSGGYRAVSSTGRYRGAYQFSQATWNSTASHAGRPDLVGVDPAAAAPATQDAMAWHLYQWQGASPWLGRCA